MARIKSALEIALEKSEGIKADKDTISAHNLKNEGKRLASNFLSPDDRETEDIKAAFSKYQGRELNGSGRFSSVCLANLSIVPTSGTPQSLRIYQKH